MTKPTGLLPISANFEVNYAQPLDSRCVVTSVDDLTGGSTWDGYQYVGMVVAVTADLTPENNGLYVLRELPYNVLSNWDKMATTASTDPLTTKLTGFAPEVGTVTEDDTILSAFNKLQGTVTNLGERYVRATKFASISIGTSGTVTIPATDTVILDDFGGTVDAIITSITDGRPDFKHALTSGGAIVTTTFDSSGNYVLSGTPTTYPVAIIYRTRTELANWDDTASNIIGQSAEEPLHEELLGMQGGTTGEHYHLTSAEHSALAMVKTPAQVITVGPDSCDYTEISTALAAITDAAANKIYQIKVFPGTYSGFQVKPFIGIIGETNGPAAPTILGKITSSVANAGEWALLNRLNVIYDIQSDGEIICDFSGCVMVNDFFCLATCSANYGFTVVKQQSITGISCAFYSANIVISSTYNGSTKNIIALEQYGTDFIINGSTTISITTANTSGTVIGRKIAISGTAGWNGTGNEIIINNTKSGSTATIIGHQTSTKSTGFRAASGGQVRLSGYGTAIGYDISANDGAEFSAIGTSIFIDSTMTGYATQTALADTQKIWLNSTNRDLAQTGTGVAIVTPYSLVQTGFSSWGTDSATMWTYDSGTKVFTVVNRGSGVVKSSPVTWAAGQSVTLSTDRSVYFIYMTSAGIIGAQTSWTKNDGYTKICLFQVWVQGTNYLVAKENHPVEFSSSVNYAWHNLFGALLQSTTQTLAIGSGANRQINVVGDNVLTDHGLDSTVTGASPITITRLYIGASGKMIQVAAASSSLVSKKSNSTDSPATVANGRYVIYRIGAIKDNINTSSCQYVSIADTTDYANAAAANNAITSGIVQAFPTELKALEVVQLGYAVVQANGADGGTLTSVVTALQVFGSQYVSGGTATSASLITTDITNFNTLLSASNTTVQSALETLDDHTHAVPAHNDTTGKQGGTTGEYYHLTSAQATVVGNTSGTNSGNETTTTIGALINGATEKTTPVDADMIGLMDSADSNILKKFSWANLKQALSSVFGIVPTITRQVGSDYGSYANTPRQSTTAITLAANSTYEIHATVFQAAGNANVTWLKVSVNNTGNSIAIETWGAKGETYAEAYGASTEAITVTLNFYRTTTSSETLVLNHQVNATTATGARTWAYFSAKKII